MTILTALIGFPTEHSLSPVIHAYWMHQHNIDGAYKLLTTPPPRLRQTMFHVRKKQMRGVNITVPHKESVLEFLDAVDVTATRIGAVNTVIAEGETLNGTNTDAYGFMQNLIDACDGTPDLSHCVLLGAGGAARAAIVALQEAGAKRITLMNRTQASAEKLADEFGVDVAEWDVSGNGLSTATLLVNTTSLGMKGQPPVNMSWQHLPESAVVYDIVYNPLETGLLKSCRARGNTVVDGLGMLLYQAQKAFALWHGVEPVVDKALRQHVIAAMRAREAA
ncbi:MAG: shikimate dehydrogenase [Azospirillum brasilense]|nr:MAG: shikimate dehydrogenase [Azospirillum brasilense]